jgi:hypothetical protein
MKRAPYALQLKTTPHTMQWHESGGDDMQQNTPNPAITSMAPSTVAFVPTKGAGQPTELSKMALNRNGHQPLLLS